MFRLYLTKKLESLDPKHARPTSRLPKNRRVFERFTIDYKHLTMLNDQDIFLVRNVSETGLCVEANQRALERLQEKSVYEAKIRYLGETYKCQLQVRWKEDLLIGFEIFELDPQTRDFLKRLIQPAQIGASLKSLQATDTRKVFLGIHNSWLIMDTKGETITRWVFCYQNDFVRWEAKSFATGALIEALTPEKIANLQLLPRAETNDTFINFAKDVIMAFGDASKEQVIHTFFKEPKDEVAQLRKRK